MNKKQFQITKLMQEMHIKLEKWAKAVRVPIATMRRAFSSPNYEIFKQDTSSDFMDQVFNGGKRKQ